MSGLLSGHLRIRFHEMNAKVSLPDSSGAGTMTAVYMAGHGATQGFESSV